MDRYMPDYDATEVCETDVEAPAAETYAAIRETDLKDPFVAALFALRELPERLARRFNGDSAPAETPRPVTFGDMLDHSPGFTLLAEDPGREFVVGSVGRFWRRNYGGRQVSAEEFIPFAEPGYAKLAVGFIVTPLGETRSHLRYEARTVTTDTAAARQFGRYWRIIHPGVALIMRRALSLIRKEAMRRAGALASR